MTNNYISIETDFGRPKAILPPPPYKIMGGLPPPPPPFLRLHVCTCTLWSSVMFSVYCYFSHFGGLTWKNPVQCKTRVEVCHRMTHYSSGKSRPWVFIDIYNSFLMTQHLNQIFEPWHEISNNVVCATSKASDQPAHTPSLIRAFASRFNIVRVLSYRLNIIWRSF